MHSGISRAAVFAATVLAAGAAALTAQSAPVGSDLRSSPTGAVTSKLFTETADHYLDVYDWAEVADPVFMLKLKTPRSSAFDSPSTWNQETTAMGSKIQNPNELGFGSLFGPYFLGAYYGFDAAQNAGIVDEKSVAAQPNASGSLIVGNTYTTKQKSDFHNLAFHNPNVLFGMKLGAMTVGIADKFSWKDATEYGTFEAVEDAGTPAIELGTVQESSFVETVLAADGRTTYRNETARYGLGRKSDLAYSNELAGGIALPMGGLTVKCGAALLVGGRDEGRSYGRRALVAQENAALPLPDYKLPAALPGGEGGTVKGLQALTLSLYDRTASETSFGFRLEGGAELPFAFNGTPATVKAMLKYAPTFYVQGGQYFGADGSQANGSNAETSRTYTRTVDAHPTAPNLFYRTTTISDVACVSDAYSADTGNVVAIPASITFEPAKDFRFAIGIEPRFTFRGKQYETVDKTIRTTIVDDTSGTAPEANPVYSKTVAETAKAPVAVKSDYARVEIALSTGVQFFVLKDRLRVNLGANANSVLVDRTDVAKTAKGYDRTTTTVTSLGNTTVATSTAAPDASSADSTNGTLGTTVVYDAGLSYFFSPNIVLDLRVVDSAAFNLAGTGEKGGFLDLRNYSVQLTIKLPPVAR